VRRRRLYLLTALLIFWPGMAHAQIWWDFIESLSGPGPFHGGGGYWRLACGKAANPRVETWDADPNCFDDSSERIRHLVEVRGLIAATDGGERPVLIADPADKRKVWVHKIDVVAAYRILPALDVGAGGGYIGFKVDGGPNVYRPILVPMSVTYAPLAVKGRNYGWSRLLRIRLDVNYIPFGFTGADWGKPDISTSDYSTDGNWVLSGGLLFDFGSITKRQSSP
jgi:hypothetical protein